MQTKRRADCQKTCRFSAVLERFDHRWQIHIREPVAVIGKKHLLALDISAHSKQALANIAPDSGVDHADAPLLLGIANRLDLGAETRDDAVSVGVRPIVEEELFDCVCLITEAQDEVLVSILAIIVHQMPENRLVTDGDHRLWDRFGVVAYPGAETSAEENGFHAVTIFVRGSNTRAAPLENYGEG
jgi:hypothetical protein